MIALQSQKLTIFETELKERDYRIEKLKHELAGLRRHRFGSRSEPVMPHPIYQMTSPNYRR